MIALKIEKQPRGRYRILTDEDVSILLYYKEMKALEIEEGKEITEKAWRQAQEILLTRGKKRVYHLLGRQDYTVSDIRNKLHKDGYSAVLVDQITTYFIDKGFIDDLRYIEKYYEYYKDQKSRRMIEMKLKEKGIDSAVLKGFFDELSAGSQESDTAARLLHKKFANKQVTRDDYVKMVRFLSYKGFNYDVCRAAVEELLKQEDSWREDI